MQRTAEAVSLGHPDKIADYISSYILDRIIEQDPQVKYAVEVLIKDNNVVLGGEVTTSAPLGDLTAYVKAALAEIGYDDRIETAIVAIPMLQDEDLTDLIVSVLGERPEHIIVNGTGRYTYHGSIADCGITGRKLACDFYSTACPIGGGSPWTKDASKADLTLNIYARILACENLADNDECFVYLSSCIGRSELPSGLVKTIKDGVVSTHNLWCNQKPSALIKAYGLHKPIYADLCGKGISGIMQ